MPKNILVFSDGTGQAGGLRAEQRLSNIYKLYRATRVDPMNAIDPADQIAFYDAGLGTDEDVSGAWFKFARWTRKTIGAATGRGISQNITDCYSFIIDHWQPGDRIWLFGFSRGAYTARCVANLLSVCGVPTLDGEEPLQRFSRRSRAIAKEAVTRVYEHGAGRPLADFEAERNELARRFRSTYGSGTDELPNADPYFIGVFDTVAALGVGGAKRFGLWTLIGLFLLVLCAELAALVAIFSPSPFLLIWSVTFASAVAVFTGLSIWKARRTIRDFPNAGDSHTHFISWKAANYDRKLSRRVRYARHAIALDETRADFDRVRWGKADVIRQKEEGEAAEPFIQLWFAGNHSDIGGSYPETESRLSDIALSWMIEEAISDILPHPLLFEPKALNLYPSAAGIQHCEIDSFAQRHPHVAKLFNWPAKARKAQGHTLHPSVIERLEMQAVPQCGRSGPYRPKALEGDERFARLYGTAPAADTPPKAGDGQTAQPTLL